MKTLARYILPLAIIAGILAASYQVIRNRELNRARINIENRLKKNIEYAVEGLESKISDLEDAQIDLEFNAPDSCSSEIGDMADAIDDAKEALNELKYYTD